MRTNVSLRVSWFLWADEDRRRELLELLREYHEAIDEVAFFTAFTHPPLPLAVVKERASMLADVMPRFREIGLAAGINHLATIGHLDENLPNSLDEPWQHLVDIGGGVSKSCYCVADPKVREYVRASYAALAAAKPDFIWVDDDVRLEHHPPAVTLACFCERCVAEFSAETGRTWTREELKAGLLGPDRADSPASGDDEHPTEERSALWRSWLAHNRKYLADLLSCIRGAVDGVDLELPLGLMSCELPYSGYAFEDLASALAGDRNVPVKWRPGGGFYTDAAPLELVTKAHSVGRQVSLLPQGVTDVQYEHENFPYQRLKKSRTIFISETAAALGAGCTGVALNLMGISSDPIDEYRPYFDAVREARPLFERAAEVLGRSACEGIWPAFTRDHAAYRDMSSGWGGVGPGELAEIGLPTAYAREGASVSLLSGNAPLEFSNDELVEILSGGVVMDGPALVRANERLADMGLERHTGFAVRGTRVADSIEVFTDDPVNGPYAGWHRDCRPSFWRETTYLIKPTSPESRPLSEIVDFTPQRHGPASGIFENELGGRVAVLGYYPWRSLQSLAKSSQMKSLCRWLSRDGLPAWVESYARALLWCRRDARGLPAALLVNASIDPAGKLALRMREPVAAIMMTRMDGSVEKPAVNSPQRGGDAPYAALEIERLGPWEAVLLSCE